MLRVLTPRVCIYHTHDLNSLWYTEQHQCYPVVGTFALFFSYSHKPRRSHIRVPIINIQPEAAITCNWYETLIKISRDKYCWAQIWDATASTATFSFDYELQRLRAVSAPTTPILQHESHTIAYNNIARTATSDPIPIRTLEFLMTIHNLHMFPQSNMSTLASHTSGVSSARALWLCQLPVIPWLYMLYQCKLQIHL